jgi:DNA (cytosine-5)-methyltransferase 1
MVDLFAGCGGGAMGFQAAGFQVSAAVEIDKAAASAYQLNVGVQPILSDIRQVTGSDLLKAASLAKGQCTLLFGCPPCQSFTALRLGGASLPVDVERDALPREYVRLAGALLPRHIAFENVPGMKAGRGKAEFTLLLDGLESLGYNIVHDVIDAADFGVPQHRKRVLVIGSLDAEARMPSPTHSALGGRGRKIAAHRTVRHAIGHLPELASGGTDKRDPYHRARRHGALALERLAAIPEGGGRDCLPEHLVLECHKNHDGHHDIYGRMWWGRPSPTLTSGCTNMSRGRFAHPEQARAITLREAMLLQTFPRRTQLSGTGEQMALQIGNAVPTGLAVAIGSLIHELEREATGNRRSAA